MVERQLCKLEVRGSNPLASSPESFQSCHGGAKAKADIWILDLRFAIGELSKCARGAPRSKIEKSAIENLRFGGEATVTGL